MAGFHAGVVLQAAFRGEGVEHRACDADREVGHVRVLTAGANLIDGENFSGAGDADSLESSFCPTPFVRAGDQDESDGECEDADAQTVEPTVAGQTEEWTDQRQARSGGVGEYTGIWTDESDLPRSFILAANHFSSSVARGAYVS
ncbi:hypothetical protein GCM10027262_73040 [Nocardia tengchongensis]